MAHSDLKNLFKITLDLSIEIQHRRIIKYHGETIEYWLKSRLDLMYRYPVTHGSNTTERNLFLH